MSQTQSSNPAFSSTTMLALVLVSFVCVTGLALLSSMEPELRSGNDGRAQALSKSSIGYSAMVSLTRVLRHRVSLERNQLKQDTSRATLILTPPSSTDSEQLLEYKYTAATIVLVQPNQNSTSHPFLQKASTLPPSGSLFLASYTAWSLSSWRFCRALWLCRRAVR